MEAILQKGQLLVAPVVLISACGLLALALYQRLSSLSERAGTFYREEFDLASRLLSLGPQAQQGALGHRIRRRSDSIEEQRRRMLGRADLVRMALIFLLVTVICMLVSSMLLAVPIVNSERVGVAAGLETSEGFLVWALGTFLAGVVFMIAAMVLAILELARALDRGVLARAGQEPVESPVGPERA